MGLSASALFSQLLESEPGQLTGELPLGYCTFLPRLFVTQPECNCGLDQAYIWLGAWLGPHIGQHGSVRVPKLTHGQEGPGMDQAGEQVGEQVWDPDVSSHRQQGDLPDHEAGGQLLWALWSCLPAHLSVALAPAGHQH